MYQEESDSWKRWGYGLIGSVAFVIYGAICLFRQEIMLGRQGSRYALTGPGAIAAGITLLCAGAYLHLYFYYRDSDEATHRRLHFVGTLTSAIVGGLALVVFLGFLLLQFRP